MLGGRTQTSSFFIFRRSATRLAFSIVSRIISRAAALRLSSAQRRSLRTMAGSFITAQRWTTPKAAAPAGLRVPVRQWRTRRRSSSPALVLRWRSGRRDGRNIHLIVIGTVNTDAETLAPKRAAEKLNAFDSTPQRVQRIQHHVSQPWNPKGTNGKSHNEERDADDS